MINFSFSLRNPFSRLYQAKVVFTTILFEYKSLEIEYVRDTDIIGVWFDWTFRQSHAGISFGISLLSFGFYFTFEDTRHWNYTNNTWKKYDDEEQGW